MSRILLYLVLALIGANSNATPLPTVPIVFLDMASYHVLEEDSQVVIGVVRDGHLSSVTTVLFTTLEDTALGGEDFTEVNTTLHFLPGERSKTVVVILLNDSLLEEEETFSVSVSVDDVNVTVARNNASVTIVDTDSFEVGFEMETYTIDEVTGRLEVTITSRTPYPGPTETVLTMITTNGTAQAPEDYFPLNIFLVFLQGTQNVSIVLHAFEDLVVEPELEWFSLSLDTLVAPADRVFFTQQNTTIFIEDKNTIQLELVPSSIMINEGSSSVVRTGVTVVVSSSGVTERPITVFFTTSDQTATAAQDYVPIDIPLTFTQNVTSFNITLEIMGDMVVENDEVLVAEIVVPEGETGVSLRSSPVAITIIDDDSVVLMFTDGDVTVQEGAGQVELTVFKFGINSRDVHVTFATLGGDAVDSEDYTPTSGSLIFTPSDVSKSVVVFIRDDSVVEYPERLFLTLSVPDTEGGVALLEPRRVAITITNDDVVEVGFTQLVYSVREDEESVQLLITKSGANVRDVSVAFTTKDGTAMSSDDYIRRTQIISFTSEDNMRSVRVPILDDSLAERVERFSVTLLPTIESVTLSPGRGQATVEIIDNDFVVVGFSALVYTAHEGNISVAVTLGKRGASNLPITVEYYTADDTASVLEDYFNFTSASITFSGLNTEPPTLHLRLKDDGVPERTEQLHIHLRLPTAAEYGLTLENSFATVIILDNDAVTVKFEPLSYHVNESSGAIVVRLVLLGEISNTVAVTVHTVDQDAKSPSDYIQLTSSVVFPAGAREQTVAISVVDDTVLERTESFSLELSPLSSGVEVEETAASVVIHDDDAVSVGFQTPLSRVSEDTGRVLVTVELDIPSDVPFTVLLTTQDNSATAPRDYLSLSESLVFSPGESSRVVSITILTDSALESSEQFLLSLSSTNDTRAIVQPEKMVTVVEIIDTSEVSVGFKNTSVKFRENSESAMLVLDVDGEFERPVSVQIATHDGTARAGEDYIEWSRDVNIPAGEIDFVVEVLFLDDVIVEGDEYFSLNLSTTDANLDISTSTVIVMIQEDDSVLVTFDPISYTVSEGGGQVVIMVMMVGNNTLVDVVVTFRTTDDTAIVIADYVGVLELELTFGPTTTEHEIPILITDDSALEHTESFQAVLSGNESVRFLGHQATVWIQDNDEVSIEYTQLSFFAIEGEPIIFLTLIRHGISYINILLNFTSHSDTATAGADFISSVPTVQFETFQQRQFVPIRILDDMVVEGNESFNVSLFSSSPMRGVLLNSNPARVTIHENDYLVVSFDPVMYTVREDAGAVTLTATVQGNSTITLPLVISTSPNNATADVGEDFATTILTVDIHPNVTLISATIPILDDVMTEGVEVFSVVMTSSSEFVLLENHIALVQIVDEDGAAVRVGFESMKYTVSEAERSVDVCLTKSAAVTNALSFLLYTKEKSAQDDMDFVPVTREVLFGPDKLKICVSISILDDSIVERTEDFLVVVESMPLNDLVINRLSIAPAIIDICIINDDIVVIGFTKAILSVREGSARAVTVRVVKVGSTSEATSVVFTTEERTAGTGLDFEPRSGVLVFSARDTEKEIVIPILDDLLLEGQEYFLVVLSLPLMNQTGIALDGEMLRVEIEDDDGPTILPMCKALDSVVIEPFRLADTLADSYIFHSPCEHTLLSTCNISSQQQLRVTVNFSPSNLDILGLAIQINRTTTITIFQDQVVDLKNLSDPIFSNRTYSLYPGGISITNDVRRVNIVLADFGVKIDRVFAEENQVLIGVLEGSSAARLCGLCGTVNGVLLYNDRRTEAISIDSSLIEVFAESWRVSPQELLLGQQGEECGAIRNDTIIGDPLFTVPLNSPSPVPSLTHLCFEVHGERDSIFNLISDRCTSVNALFTAMTPPTTGNVVNTVGIKAVDYRGNCVEIEVSLRAECWPVVYGSDRRVIAMSRYNSHGVSVRKHQQGVRVAVPNCENVPLVLWVLCNKIQNQSMLKFVVSRGVNLRPTSHGILGQFWNIPMTIEPFVTTTTPLTLISLPPPYTVTLSPPSSHPRQFLARLHSNTWDKRGEVCYYAGSAQGGALGQIESPHLRDSVIEGRYTDYIMGSLFETQFPYTRFDSSECPPQR